MNRFGWRDEDGHVGCRVDHEAVVEDRQHLVYKELLWSGKPCTHARPRCVALSFNGTVVLCILHIDFQSKADSEQSVYHGTGTFQP